MSQQSYDYIIIGGGSAGCVLANRLSKNPNITVCLLEAGPRDTNPFIRMPLGIIMVIRSKILNWQYRTTPQVECAERTIYWPRGRTLGGSSAINAMIYIRGTQYDYDAWAKLGNVGWSYNDVLPYFQKAENFKSVHNATYGTNGPLKLSEHRYVNPLENVFVEAGVQAGYKKLDDFNGEEQEGVGLYVTAQHQGERYSNAAAYLREAEKRENLTVLTHTHVTQIVFRDKRAVGVNASRKQQRMQLDARKEVLLCAGSIGSPQLLLLSGVGPRDEVGKHQIPLVHDLPGVGENLQDHLDIHITHLEKTRFAFSFHVASLWRHLKSLWQYVFHRRGELTINYAQAGGFIKTNTQQLSPQLQWHFVPSIFTNSAQRLGPLFYSYGYTLMTCLLHPQSRGKITLKNADPFTPPNIDAGYLSHSADLDEMVTGFKLSRKILAQPAFDAYRGNEIEPGTAVQSDEAIRDYIRKHAETIYHPVGTCKMGIDKMAVVDPELKVHGLIGLRVIDASVMPLLPSGNTNAATTMIAEKGADLLLQQR